MLPKVEQFIREKSLLASGDHVLVALSGGADSVALLLTLHRLSTQFHLHLTAVYINHGLRPKAARAEELFCRELCEGLNVPLQIERADVKLLAKEQGVGIEEAGRTLRYNAFARLADQLGCTKVATGHHADDQAETVLFRVLRGTGTSGLAGIQPRRGMVVRPLLSCTRTDIIEFLSSSGVSFCEDRSNRDQRFSRNYLRHTLLPQIRQRLNPNVDRALQNLADNAADSEAIVAKITAEVVSKLAGWTVGGKLRLALSNLRGYDEAIQRRVLRHCLALLSPEGAAPDRDTVLRLMALGRQSRGGLSLPDGLEARQTGEELLIYRPTKPVYAHPLELGGICRLDLPMLTIRATGSRRYNGRIERKRRSATVTVDAERIDGLLTVRPIRRGDRFRPLGARGQKKVSDYLTDRKVPPVLRDEIPVVADEKGIVWLVGFEIADRVKVDQRTTEVITLGVSKQKQVTEKVV